jgi:hypothetical protein
LVQQGAAILSIDKALVYFEVFNGGDSARQNVEHTVQRIGIDDGFTGRLPNNYNFRGDVQITRETAVLTGRIQPNDIGVVGDKDVIGSRGGIGLHYGRTQRAVPIDVCTNAVSGIHIDRVIRGVHYKLSKPGRGAEKYSG